MKFEQFQIRFPENESAVDTAVHSLRLMTAPNGNRLYLCATRPAPSGRPFESVVTSRLITDLKSPAKTEFTVGHILATPPHWDVAEQKNGSLSLAISLAEGGNSALSIVVPKDKKVRLPGAKTSDHFDHLRFVRRHRDPQGPAVSAILNRKTLVVYPATGAGNYGPSQTITSANDALVLQLPDGFALFIKTDTDGPVRGQSIRRGTLHFTKLGADFVPVRPPEVLFLGETIFEFDADLYQGILAVYATTSRGISLLLFTGEPDHLEFLRQTSRESPLLLTSPGILADEPGLRIAALADAGAEKARVLIGRFQQQQE